MNPASPPALYQLEGVFGNLTSALVPFAGIVLFLVLIFGGYKYISSGSDPAKAQAAKNTITYAIIGIAVVALGFFILNLIALLTGKNDILFFRIYQP